VSEDRGVDGSDDDFLWYSDFNRWRCSGDEGCLTTVTFFFFFYSFLNHMHLFQVQRQHSALTLWPTKTISSSPQETSKPPSPSRMRPTAHLAYRLTKSHEHTRKYKGSRKERNKQEGEENPYRHLPNRKVEQRKCINP